MPTRLLILIAFLALLVEIIFTPFGVKPWWQSIALILGFNFSMALLWYAAHGRFADSDTFVPGLDKSTKKGLIGIALFGVWSAVLGLLFGLFLWPVVSGDSPAFDFSGLHRMWPTMIFTDVVSLLLKRWRATSKAEASSALE